MSTLIRRAIMPLLALAILASIGCASQNTPYDVPVVGEDGVAQITGTERWEYGSEQGEIKEVLVFHAIMEDGTLCDFVWMKSGEKAFPDNWLALGNQKTATFGIFSGAHRNLPEDVCLTVTRR